MLLTSEIIRRLALGELRTHSMAAAKDGTLTDEGKAQVLVHLNDSLRDLFTKFLLRQRELIVMTDPTITHYYLREEFAIGNEESQQPYLYIDTSLCEDWGGRVGKILDVYDAFGRQLYMNKKQEPLSVFTPEHDCLQITANHTTEAFHVIFAALHPIVNLATSPAEDTTINLPPALEKPLVLLTASKVFGDVNGEPNMLKSAQLHQLYEVSLTDVELRDTHSASENMSNGKLDINGFV